MVRRHRLGPKGTARLRVALATILAAVAFALVGAVGGPGWNPDTLTTTVTVESSSVAVLGSTPETVLGRYETASRLVDLELAEDVVIQVLVVEPVGLSEPAPAVVFLHGAGTGYPEAFAQHAEAFASAGIVAVVPAKRLDTYSTFHRDYVAMAADYGRSVELARSLPSVDPDRVGLYSESEGTWSAPVLAVADPDIAFLAMVGAPVVSPREQSAFAVDAYLRAVGVPAPLLRAIPRAAGARLPGGLLAFADFDVLPYLRQTTQPVFMAYGTEDLSMPTVQGPQILRGAVPGGTEQVMVRYYGGANHGIRIGTYADPPVPDFLAGVAAWMLDPEAANAAGPLDAGATPVQRHLAAAVPQPRWYADGEMLFRVPLISALVVAGGFALLIGAWAVRTAVAARARRRARAERRALAAAGVGSGDAARDSGDGAPRSGATAELTVAEVEAAGERATRADYLSSVVWFAVAMVTVVLVLAVYIAAVAQLALNYSTNGFVVWGGWILLQLLAVASALCGVLAIRALLRTTARWRAERAAGDLVGADVPLLPRTAPGVAALVRGAGAWAVVLGSAGMLFVAAYWGAFSPLS